MIRSRPRPKLHAYAALSVAVFTTWGACRDLVAGDAKNIMDELCSTLDACYGGDPTITDCETTLRERLDGGTESEVAAFVRYVGAHDCFDTCPHALGCTDLAPFCQTDRQACLGRSDCCDWSRGVQDCVDGACCQGRGQKCVALEDCCDRDCRSGFCGGSACADVDAPCHGSFECCTQRCVLGKCEALSECAGLDESCQSDADCCTDTAVSEPEAGALFCDLASHRCKPPDVCGLGSACERDADGLSCCGGGLECWPTASGGVCGQQDCAPVDVDCASDGDCCLPAVCSYLGFPHCEIVNGPGCTESGAACTQDAECCSNACGSSGTTAGKCLEYVMAECDDTSTCHDACAAGEPMSGASCADDPSNAAQASCIAAIVQADPFCGCTEWDALCVEAAIAQCPCP